MKIDIDAEDLSYFEKHGRIEFEGLFTLQEIKLLWLYVDQELARRCDALSFEDRPFAGKKPHVSMRDFSSSSEAIRKTLYSKKCAHVAALLLHKKPLRWGFDHLFSENSFTSLTAASYDLSSALSVSKVLLLCAISSHIGEESPRALFMKPSTPDAGRTDFPQETMALKDRRGPKVLLFGYAEARPMYIFNEKDPDTHSLKQQGYVFGDLLKETTHPTLVR